MEEYLYFKILTSIEKSEKRKISFKGNLEKEIFEKIVKENEHLIESIEYTDKKITIFKRMFIIPELNAEDINKIQDILWNSLKNKLEDDDKLEVLCYIAKTRNVNIEPNWIKNIFKN